ncbi:hypothetical protein PM082_010717 [Marasmius tenuissimus]|nr:hypothetical protein PM082_010717 [Marasmius tenuissimus]
MNHKWSMSVGISRKSEIKPESEIDQGKMHGCNREQPLCIVHRQHCSSQSHSLAVCQVLSKWFARGEDHKVPSKAKWSIHQLAHEFVRGLPPIDVGILVHAVWKDMGAGGTSVLIKPEIIQPYLLQRAIKHCEHVLRSSSLKRHAALADNNQTVFVHQYINKKKKEELQYIKIHIALTSLTQKTNTTNQEDQILTTQTIVSDTASKTRVGRYWDMHFDHNFRLDCNIQYKLTVSTTGLKSTMMAELVMRPSSKECCENIETSCFGSLCSQLSVFLGQFVGLAVGVGVLNGEIPRYGCCVQRSGSGIANSHRLQGLPCHKSQPNWILS